MQQAVTNRLKTAAVVDFQYCFQEWYATFLSNFLSESKVLRYFSNILPKSWRWRTTLDCVMPCLPDTLRLLLVEFASIALSTASESTFLGLPDLTELSGFWQPELNYLNHLVTITSSTAPSPFAQLPRYYQSHRVPFHGLNCYSHMMYFEEDKINLKLSS